MPATARPVQPIPEAPRMIWDAVGSYNKLPFHLRARGEFEFVKAKPLDDGFTGVPVTGNSGRNTPALSRRSHVDRRELPDRPRLHWANRRRHSPYPIEPSPSIASSAFR